MLSHQQTMIIDGNHSILLVSYPVLPPILSTATCQSIAGLHLYLNANAVSLQSHLSNDQLLGLLALTVSTAVYNPLSAMVLVIPNNPEPMPVPTIQNPRQLLHAYYMPPTYISSENRLPLTAPSNNKSLVVLTACSFALSATTSLVLPKSGLNKC